MARIPYGRTISYKEFAVLAGKPNARVLPISLCAQSDPDYLSMPPCGAVRRIIGELWRWRDDQPERPRESGAQGLAD